MVAPTRNDDTGVFVAESTAVAVWLALCGSTPMIMLLVLWSQRMGHHGRHADFETHYGGITPLLSQTVAGRQLGGTPR